MLYRCILNEDMNYEGKRERQEKKSELSLQKKKKKKDLSLLKEN